MPSHKNRTKRRGKTRTECLKCKRMFWARQKSGVILDAFCKRCLALIRQDEMKKRRKRKPKGEKKKMDSRGAKAPMLPPRRELPKIKGRTPDQIRCEIRWLEYRRAKEFPKLRKDDNLHNLRMIQAHDIITKTIKSLYQELEVTEKLGLKGHGKKKRKR